MTELVRPRLSERLESRLPIVVVEAWDGAGKETLLRQWVSAATAKEMRVLIDAGRRERDAASLAGLLLTELDDRGVAIDAVAAAAEPEEAAEAALRALGPVRIAFLGVDCVEAEALVDLVDRWSRQSGVQSILATADATGLRHILVRRGTPHRWLTDADLRLDREELAEFVRGERPEIEEPALDHLADLTGGTVGVVAAALRTCPEEVLAGTLTRAQAMRFRWPDGRERLLPIERFVAATAPACRLLLSELPDLVDTDDPQRQLERVVELGWGTLTVAGVERSPAFRWETDWRDHVLRVLGERRSPEESAQDLSRVAAVAQRHGDHELHIVTLVAAGDLEGAAAVARTRLWEVMSTDDLALWTPLLDLPVARLMNFPSLASLHVVLRFRLGHRLAKLDVMRELERRYPEASRVMPADRFHHLATAMYVAARLGELGSARAAVRGLVGFTELLPDLTIDAGSVSDLLLVVEALVRLDRLDLAAMAAGYALRALEMDASHQVDPGGRRRHHAEAVLEMCARHVGDPVALSREAAPDHPVDPQREIDVVAQAVVRGWEALDAGDAAKAVELTSAVMRTVDPVDWPALLVVHVLSAVGAGDMGEVDRVWVTYLKSRRWRSRHVWAAGASASARELDALCVRVLGVRPPVAASAPAESPRPRSTAAAPATSDGALPLNDRLTNDDPFLDIDALNPRAQQMALVMETTRAVRAGEPERAVAALTRALEAAPGSGLVRVLLGTARPADRERLREQLTTAMSSEVARISDVLDAVVPVGRERENGANLSDRERQVLALVRAGMTNREIAEHLYVSVNTVKFHRANLYRKFDVDTRDRLLAAALRVGM